MNVPYRWRVRLFLLLWWLTSWIITISYSCNLTAIITVPVFPRRIQTLQELAESDYRLCMLDYGEFVPEALATSTHFILFSLGKKMDLVPLLIDLPLKGFRDCMDRVIAGTHGQTESYPYVESLYKSVNQSEEEYALREYIYPNHLVFLIHKHSPWKQKFDIGMQRSVEIGLSHKWYQDAFEDIVGHQHKDASATSELRPLTLDYLEGPFYFLLCGLLVSTFGFALEMFTSAI